MSEVDDAMNAAKQAVLLEENIFELSQENLPPENHADPHGKIMVHSTMSGWRCIKIESVSEHLEYCRYYTFTPPQPPPIKEELENG